MTGVGMKVLAGWDVESEFELLLMYLEVDDNEVTLVRTPKEVLELALQSSYDAILLPVTFPDHDETFELFKKIIADDPQAPVIAAARPGETYPLSRLIRHGLRSHLFRDPDGEFLFLLQTMLKSSLEAKRSQRARELAMRLREEIDSVRKLQESILPRDLRALPGYEIAARYEPSQIRVHEDAPVVLAGGDYYHVFRMENRRLIMLVGDASGHGMKACLSIMSMHTLINQMQEGHRGSPHEFVGEINRKLCADDLMQGEGGFITLLYGCVEDNILYWTAAGHPRPLLQNLETGSITELGAADGETGPPLGVFEEAEYTTNRHEIPPAHRLLIYTDGVAEAFPDRPSPPEFGMEGIQNVLRKCAREPLNATLETLFNESFAFTEGAGRHDDTSVLLLERK